MKRLVLAAVVAAAVGVGAQGTALADSPLFPLPNPGTPASLEHAGSCIGPASSIVTHNGAVVSEQARAGLRAEETGHNIETCPVRHDPPGQQ